MFLVKVTQRWHLQGPVQNGDGGAVLQAEVDQVGEVGKHVVRRNHKVIVGQVQVCQLVEVSSLQDIQDHSHGVMAVKRATEVQGLQHVVLWECSFTESLHFVVAQVQAHKVWQVVKYLCIHGLQLIPTQIEIS